MRLPGDEDFSPIVRYLGLREKTAEERLAFLKVVMSVGATFEANPLKDL